VAVPNQPYLTVEVDPDTEEPTSVTMIGEMVGKSDCDVQRPAVLYIAQCRTIACMYCWIHMFLQISASDCSTCLGSSYCRS
jgi:hypothetical protein